MIEQEKGKVSRYELERLLTKPKEAKELLDLLYGQYNNDYCTDYEIATYRYQDGSKTVCQRLNMLWAVPLTILCMPFQYVIKGTTGWSKKTIFGRWICKVTGH